MPFGYHGLVLHVDLNTATTSVERPSDNFYRLYGGGGLMGTYYLLKHTPAGIDPLGPDNVLVLNNSVVAGYPSAGLVRYVVTTKSPLTDGIGETRGEGSWAVALKHSGYDALVIHGAAAEPVSLIIEDGQPRIVSAAALWGKTVGETNDAYAEEYDRAVDVAAIGRAGEAQVRYASIVTNRTHQAQRHGVGAVMGAKRLKAIVIVGGALPPVAHPDRLAALNARFAADMKQNVLSMWQKDLPGFAVWVHTHGLDAALNTENYRTAAFASLEHYKAANWMPYFQRNAKCPGCPNDCIKIYHNHDEDLDMRAGGMHQEVSGTMGPNIGTQHPRMVMRYNNLCNQHGLDPVSLGFTLSFAMEAHAEGVLPSSMLDGIDLRFGNSAATLAMIDKIIARDGIGAVLAEGAARAAAAIGNGADRYAMHVKGLELVPFEPRSQSNLALGYATAPIGPRYDICEHDWDFDTTVGWDHSLDYARTIGILDRIPMEYLGPEKVRNYKALHTLWSGADALAFCIFAIAPTRVLSMRLMTDMVAAITGWETSSHELLRYGERRTHLMQVYNRREGLTAATDTLPDRFFDEGIDSGDKAGIKLDRAAFAAEIALYYEMMGWDTDGIPRPATLYDHHLEWAVSMLPTKPAVATVAPVTIAPVTIAAVPDAVSTAAPTAAAQAPVSDTLPETASRPLRSRERVSAMPTPKPLVPRGPTVAGQAAAAFRPATPTAPGTDATPTGTVPATLVPAADTPIPEIAAAHQTSAVVSATPAPIEQQAPEVNVDPTEAAAPAPTLQSASPAVTATDASPVHTVQIAPVAPAAPIDASLSPTARTAEGETPSDADVPVVNADASDAPPAPSTGTGTSAIPAVDLLNTLLSESPITPSTSVDELISPADATPTTALSVDSTGEPLVDAAPVTTHETVVPTTVVHAVTVGVEPIQPHTQLPPPAVKHHQARPLGIPAPVDPPAPTPIAPVEPVPTAPPPQPQTRARSIAKRLSIQDMLNADVPHTPPRTDE